MKQENEPDTLSTNTHVASHGYAGDAQRTQALPLTPVEDDQTLQHQTPSHHKQVRHIVETGAPATRTAASGDTQREWRHQ